MKQKLYIHIGRPKTGSSSLQVFLHRNRDALLRQGIYYPETGRYQRASHKLSLVYLPRLPDSAVVSDIDAESLYRSLVREVRDSGAPAAVISSEHFWLVKPATLPGFLRDAFDIEVIAYLRRQDSALISSFVQEVKGGSLSLDVDLDRYIGDSARLGLLDYSAVLARWADVFGTAAINARLYENARACNGIESDFLEAMGVRGGAELGYNAAPRNVSPSLEVLRLVEELEPLDLDKATKRQLIELVGKAGSALPDLPGTDASAMFSLEQRRQILDHFGDSNRRLGQDFFGLEGSPFPPLEGFTSAGDQGAVPGMLDAEQRARLLTAVVAQQQRQVEMLKNQLARMQEELGIEPPSGRRRAVTHVSNSLLAKIGRLLARK